jgi:hypothetical protein
MSAQSRHRHNYFNPYPAAMSLTTSNKMQPNDYAISDDDDDDDGGGCSDRRIKHEINDTPVSPSSASKSNNNDNFFPYPRNWLEQWAQEGAQEIAQLDIHERTQRALLAEMAEDKIYELNEALERLLDEDTGEILDMDQARDIAQQTKSLQEQYRTLVKGGPSSMLQAMASLNDNNSSSDGM